MVKHVPLRRIPRQARGQRRMDAILDAAERVFAEVGYEAATTNAIAARAGTAIGSLYQYFPNKEAILRALADRFLDQLRGVLDVALDDAAALADAPLESLVDRILDPVLAVRAARAGILDLYFRAGRPGGEVAQAAHGLIDEIVARLDAIVAAREPWLDPEPRRLRVRIVVEVVRALLPLTAPGGVPRPEVIAELKRVVRAYMAAIRDEVTGNP